MDIAAIRTDFPIYLHKPDLVYLDSTATSLKPIQVIKKEQEYYEQYTANVHRGIYKIAEQATAEYEKTREVVAEYIHSFPEQIVFTRGATEAINMVATGYPFGAGELVTTIMEHHSNFVPWQQLAKKNNSEFKVIPISEEGILEFVNPDGRSVNETIMRGYVNERTSVFAFTAVSNVLGTINPVAAIVKAVRKISPKTVIVVDAAQAAPHAGINVAEWDADFVAFSAHKMLGPTGVGVLWGKKEQLKKLQPSQYGGEMVLDVGIEKTVFKDVPYRFEAGTPNIAGVIAFKEAIIYAKMIGIKAIRAHEKELVEYAFAQFKEKLGRSTRIIGTTNSDLRAGIITFALANFHAHDTAQILDEKNICVRAGHHCAMPLHNHLDLVSSTRASFYLYTTKQDIDRLVKGLLHVQEVLR